VRTCPNCGKKLSIVVTNDAATPPYACFDCTRGWWPAELTPQARALWDPTSRSFTMTIDGATVRQQARKDAADARLRGTAITTDLVDLLSPDSFLVLQAQAPQLDSTMRKSINDRITREKL
jgi:hypothetical protein